MARHTAHAILRSKQAFTLIELMVVVAIIAIILGIVVPNYVTIRARSLLTSCEQTLQQTGTALEVYASENSGHYPTSLHQLTPNWLKTIPTCPSVNSDTYSSSFISVSSPDMYTVCCGALAHTGAGLTTPNYPQYMATQGLIATP